MATLSSTSSPEALQYLVRCTACDRAFWQAEGSGPVPEHTVWLRGAWSHAETERRCRGSDCIGHWVARDDRPPTITRVTGWSAGA
jgi:hypothetical protein